MRLPQMAILAALSFVDHHFFWVSRESQLHLVVVAMSVVQLLLPLHIVGRDPGIEPPCLDVATHIAVDAAL